ncbi:hypothetical protein [Veillonella rogosae]|uniref:hypothetical protein n=1 Tax=Veillonella rogosae TaxID=423477 RepID=UPI002092AA96|nr:hypothetical protein [Veillonella rogosae]
MADNHRSVLSTGARVAPKGSAVAEIGQFILHNALEMERITYTFTNPYVPPRPYKPMNTPCSYGRETIIWRSTT